MKVQVVINLDVPDEFEGVGPWGKEASVYSFIEHWLTEGYGAHDHVVSLPEGIEYQGFNVIWLEKGQDSEDQT